MHAFSMSSPIWQKALYIGLTAASGISTLGSLYWAAKFDMYKHTDQNLKDSAAFLGFTIITSLQLGAVALRIAEEIGLIELLNKLVK